MTKEEIRELGKKVRKENIKRSVLNITVIFIILISAYIGCKLFVGEFIPIIHKTETAKAKVIKVTRYHWGKGVHKYMMTYEFDYKKDTYYGKYDLWSNIDKVGDSVEVKYARHNPNINEVQ